MAKRITVGTTLDEALGMTEMAPYRHFMVYAPDHVPEEELPTHGLGDKPLAALSQLGWSAEGIAEGLNAFIAAIGEGRVSQHFVYGESDDLIKRDVNLIRIVPASPDPAKPFVVLCAGGAYKNVCTIAEGISVGRHFFEAGYQVLLLTYRVSVPEVAPCALDDVAAALDWLARHAVTLGIDPERYVIGGFSAGGNLACTWGLPHLGWQAHNLPKPLCVLGIYTCVDLELESHRNERHGMVPRMLGNDWRELMGTYDVVTNVDAAYPPCYIVCGRNDGLLSCRHSEELKECLDAAGVPAVLEEHEDAPHGFGDGTGTQAVGWPQRAMRFLDGLAIND